LTFDAWWEVLRWLALPAIGAVAWWLRELDNRRRNAVRMLHERQEAERAARHAELDAVRRELRNEIREVDAALDAWRVSSAERFATAGAVQAAVDRIATEIGRLTERLDRVLEGVRGRPS